MGGAAVWTRTPLRLRGQKQHRQPDVLVPAARTHLWLLRGPGALVVGAQLGEAAAEVVQVVDLPVQHLQEVLQLHL